MYSQGLLTIGGYKTFKAIPVLIFSTLYSYQISSWKYNLYELYTVIYSEDIEQKDYNDFTDFNYIFSQELQFTWIQEKF